MKKRYIRLILMILLSLTVSSCVDPFEPATQNYESLLVIEATITNELKYQEVNLGRTYRLENDGALYESNANVTITDDAQNTYNFQDLGSGKYRSVVAFKAELGRQYQLMVNTSDGRSFSSTSQQIASDNGLDRIYANKAQDVNGNDGISIFVDSYDPSGNSRYYRYEYEETFKVVAPYASVSDAFEVTYTPPVYEILPRTIEKRVCYKTNASNRIMQTETLALSEDRVSQFPILFIDEGDYKTTYRYSILVTQYVQTVESYNFYRTLNKFSGATDVFSQVQTGHFSGNIFSTSNKEDKVLGHFELASVSSQRIYFEHHDFFPENPYPEYFVYCHVTAPYLTKPGLGSSAGSPLLDALDSGDWVFYGINDIGVRGGPLLLVETECGDCSSFASNIKPNYWED